MANNSNGTTWYEDAPAGSDNISYGDDEIIALRKGLRSRLSKEHDWPTTGTSTTGFGEHKEGSAVVYVSSTEPSNRPDGTTSLDNDDTGRLWVDSDDESLYYYKDSTDEWQNVKVTGDSLSSTIAGKLCPVGSILPYGGSSAPTGWLLCDGTELTDGDTGETYEDLYDVIGTTFGGTGVSSFYLPDLRGRFPLGKGQSDDNTKYNNDGDAIQGSSFSLGDEGGYENHRLSEAEIPSHTHNFDGPNGAHGNRSHNSESGCCKHSDTNDEPTSSVGNDEVHNNMPPYLSLNYIIKY